MENYMNIDNTIYHPENMNVTSNKPEKVRFILTIFIITILAMPIGMITISNDIHVAAQNTQIPVGWVKFNHHSHGKFDVVDENSTVVGTIEEDDNYLWGPTGHTPEMIRDEFGENGVLVHSPHMSSFEPYKEHWESQRRYENEQWSTTTNFTLGEEYHLHGRHVGLINITYFMSYNEYTDFPSFRKNVTSQGGIMIINHPQHTYIGDPKIFLQPGYEFDGMEIYNNRVEFVGSPLAIAQTDGRADYRDAVTQGRLLAAIGGSDAHTIDGNWQSYTVAEDPNGDRDLDTVVRAIKNRRTYAAAYDMSTYDRSFYLECDQMGKIIETRDITLNVTPPSANSYTVDLFRDNASSPVQTWSTSGSGSFTYIIPISAVNDNAAYTFEVYEGGSAGSSDAIVYSTAIWYQPKIETNISLEAGWNLVSFPLILNSSSITDVLSSINGEYDVIHWFDPQAGSWMIYPGDEFHLNNTMSFWIHMKQASTLHHIGKMPFYTGIPLYSAGNGWTMVGFPSSDTKKVRGVIDYFSDKIIAVQNYNSTDHIDPWKHFHLDKAQNDLLFMESGSGYWIKVNDDCELVVFN
jgi:hypothetical protein